MTPKELAAQLASFTPQQLNQMDHATLYAARGYAKPEQQNILAPAEHRAFAREATRENPLMGLPIAVGSLAYQPYKILKGQSRSGAALDQVGQALVGVGEGAWGAFQDGMQSIRDRTANIDMRSSATGLLESLQRHLQGSNRPNMPHQ